MNAVPHQYIERHSGAVRSERLFSDAIIRFVYGHWREETSFVFRMLISRRASALLGFLNYDNPAGNLFLGARRFMKENGMNPDECLECPESLDTPRKVFERKIRYWEYRPMPEDHEAVLSPADARVLVGSFLDTSSIYLKGKYFDLDELLGEKNFQWAPSFRDGDFALFRLTPDKYHYNHAPVSGRVLDIYETAGVYHSCNPAAVVAVVTPFSKNARTVTIIDTDVTGGTWAGIVAMVEVVALMVGRVVQCHSRDRYIDPRPVVPGMFIRKGCPKSLYAPGSSTTLLLFQRGRIRFDTDILTNMLRAGVQSRFSLGFGRPVVETDVPVRSRIGVSLPASDKNPRRVIPA